MDDQKKKEFVKKLEEDKKKKKPEESLYSSLAKKGWLGAGPKAEVEKYPGSSLAERAGKKYSYED